ncbi:hypothetical protein DO225_16545 [Salmonella enterica]|nr:hypothetical protein [Salmonella enterica]EBN2823434.1 hypothetical protein [Salmonella enterica]ECU1627106.1 hypothetical protein [Salmonella enterica]
MNTLLKDGFSLFGIAIMKIDIQPVISFLLLKMKYNNHFLMSIKEWGRPHSLFLRWLTFATVK